MSQPNPDPSVQNGLPYKWEGAKNPNFPPYTLNNGLGSSQSSRDSSPVPKFSNVPLSQLPPSRSQIPSSQLPPGFSPIQKSAVFSNTPVGTPRSSSFNTSTPKTSAAPNNSFVNVTLNTGSVPQDSTVHQNGSQQHTKQNLNQGNLLINQGEQAPPMFMPVSVPFTSQSSGARPSSASGHSQLQGQLQAVLQSHGPPRTSAPSVPSANVPKQSPSMPVNSLAQSTPNLAQPSINVAAPPRSTPNLSPSPLNMSQPSSSLAPSPVSLEQSSPNLSQPISTVAAPPSNLGQMKTSLTQPVTNLSQTASVSDPVTSKIPPSSMPSMPYLQPSMNSQSQNVPPSSQTGGFFQSGPTTTQVPSTQPQSIAQPSINQTSTYFQSTSASTTASQNLNAANYFNQNIPQSHPSSVPLQTSGFFQQSMPLSLSGQRPIPSITSETKEDKTPIAAPIPFSALKTYLPTGPQQKTSHPSAFAQVGHQKGFSQSTGNLTAPPSTQVGSQNMKMTNPQLSASTQNIRPPGPAAVQPTNPLLFGASNQASSFNNQLITPPRPAMLPPTVQPTSQPSGMMNQQYNKPVTNQGTGMQQYPKPPNQMGPQAPPPLTNQQYPPLNQQHGAKTMIPPMVKSEANQMPPLSQPMGIPSGYPPTSNQPIGMPSGYPPTSNQPMGMSSGYPSPGNQPVGFQPPPTSINQNMPPPPMGNQYNKPPTNQNQPLNPLAGPPLPNQNLMSTSSSGDHVKPPSYNENINQYSTNQSLGKRYPQQKYQTATPNTYTQPYKQPVNQGYQNYYEQNLNQGMTNMNLGGGGGFNRLYGSSYDLLQCTNILPPERLEPPKVCLGQDFLNEANCSPEIFRCTMTKIPESNSLLQKSRLPLGVLIHPFKDLNKLPIIQCSTIVRCRACRTYINPFVFFVDTKRWKCNLCYRVNELPEEFLYDPVSKSYGDPSRRPEIKASTIEYIAPSEYMLRPPQPAVYLFLLDISRPALESGYLHTVTTILSSQLSSLPGDSRTQIGFLAYNSSLHFFSLGEGLSQPHEMIVSDIEDVYLPYPDNLLVNLKERAELVSDLLALLPTRYLESYDGGCALGAALQAAFKMMSPTGGRITVFQASLPMVGPGALTPREDPNQRAGKEAPHLNPATDFYKRLALECSGHQIAVDMFILNSQYVDIATLSGISRFSGGCLHHFPLFKASKTLHAENLERCFRRYLTRKIGFEAVMRIRCTRGLAVHTFHGNFFVRSTDLLSLPNVNPDAGFGMQVSIEENLSDLQTVCFQAALLYTSSKGERRIRVHTLCLPVVNTLQDVLNSADQQCIVGILSKMAVDRSLQSSLSDARDAFINVAIDILHSYKVSLNLGEAGTGLLASQSLNLLPLYILALLKHYAFRSGQSTRLDDRVFAMCEMKSLPLAQLMQQVYPDLYPIHNLTDDDGIVDADGIIIPQPPRIQLTSRNIDAHGVYLLDAGQQMIIFVCQNASQSFLTHVLGVPSFSAISDQLYELPKIDNPDNQRLHTFIASLNEDKPYWASLQIMRENSPNKTLFLEKLVEDRIESALSYNEFLQHIKTQVK